MPDAPKPANRIDHLANLREPAQAKLPEGAPSVQPTLVEYLEKTFPHPYPNGATAQSSDAHMVLAGDMANYAGAKTVIDHLKSLLESERS